MVIDSDPLVRNLLVRFLSLRGYRAVGAGTGPDALRMVEREDMPPDAILLELMRPGMSGVEVMQALREKEYPEESSS